MEMPANKVSSTIDDEPASAPQAAELKESDVLAMVGVKHGRKEIVAVFAKFDGTALMRRIKVKKGKHAGTVEWSPGMSPEAACKRFGIAPIAA